MKRTKRKLVRTQKPDSLSPIQKLLTRIRIAQKKGERDKAKLLDRKLAKLQRKNLNKRNLYVG